MTRDVREISSLISTIKSDVKQMAVQCGHIDGGLEDTRSNTFEKDGIRSILRKVYNYDEMVQRELGSLKWLITENTGE